MISISARNAFSSSPPLACTFYIKIHSFDSSFVQASVGLVLEHNRHLSHFQLCRSSRGCCYRFLCLKNRCKDVEVCLKENRHQVDADGHHEGPKYGQAVDD